VFNAQALAVTEGGLYYQTLADETECSAAYKADKFDLIICDGRGRETSLMETTEKIRSHQLASQIVLVCEKPPLDFVIKAIRLGVRDLFPAPVNLGGLLNRAEELIKPFFPGGGTTALGNCRSSLNLFFTTDGKAPSTATAKGASAADTKELNTLRLECDRLVHELHAAKEANNLVTTSSVARSQDSEAKEQTRAELESSLTLAKNKQAAELESLKVSLAALAAAQLSASQASAALTEREQQLAQKDEIQNQAVQMHEEALAELEASKKILEAVMNFSWKWRI